MARPPSLGSPTLLLLPTALELEQLEELGGLPSGLALVELCGFGPLASAARAMQILSCLRPRRVLLLGIAGTLDPERAPPESALCFSRVELDGVGAGRAESSLSAADLGFAHGPGPAGSSLAIRDSLALSGGAGSTLLTVCAASESPAHARERCERHPLAAAEDMEGFAVALSCALAAVPLAVVRGISNAAGDRDRRRWRVPGALRAARALALELLEREEWGA